MFLRYEKEKAIQPCIAFFIKDHVSSPEITCEKVNQESIPVQAK